MSETSAYTVTARVHDGQVTTLRGNPILTRPDGVRAPLLTILAPSWTEADRAEYGVYNVTVAPPDGYVFEHEYILEDGVPAPVYRRYQPTVQDVLNERGRRLALGFDYDFGDERGVHHISTTADDEAGWKAVDRWANACIALGDTTSTQVIWTGSGAVQVTAQEWHRIVAHGSDVQQVLWQRSFALQAMDPIPFDYDSDLWWTP